MIDNALEIERATGVELLFKCHMDRESTHPNQLDHQTIHSTIIWIV